MDPQLWEEIARGESSAEIDAIVRLRQGVTPPESIRIIARFGDVATCRLRRADIISVREHPAVFSLKASRRLVGDSLENQQPNRRRNGKTRRAQSRSHSKRMGEQVSRRPRVPETGRGVTVGVIDYGCDFVHHAFRNADGTTRIKYLWDQRNHEDTSKAPAPYGRGRLFTESDINDALQADDPYEALGYHPAPSGRSNARRGSHGTHVLDIAAGNSAGHGPVGVAPQAEIIFVHVASGDTGGLRNFGDSVGVLEAVDLIAQKTAGRPCVMNISMGRHGGPHDGTTLIEMALDYLLNSRPGLALVQSAGNYYGRDIHTQGRLSTDGAARVNWFVPPTDTTGNELEFWYNGDDRFSVSIFAPNGKGRFELPPGGREDLVVDGDVVGRAYHRLGDPNNSDNHIDIFLYSSAPKGRWKVDLRAAQVTDGRWHGWIERDGDSETQSYFTHRYISNQMTCGTIANGRGPIQVAAHYGDRRRTVAPFSSAGPTRDGRRVPLIAAPGVRITAARSALRDGRNSHREVTRKSGTSMAAPHVAGVVALMLEAAPSITQGQLRSVLRNTALPVTSGRARHGAHRASWGAINADAAIRLVRRLSDSNRDSAREEQTEQTLTHDLNPSEWAIVGNWVANGIVPVDGSGMLPRGRSPQNAQPLANSPSLSARYVAQALINLRNSAVGVPPSPMPRQSLRGRTPVDVLAYKVLAAMPPSQSEWMVVGAFMEHYTTQQRSSTGGRDLFGTHGAVNRLNLAHHLACLRLRATAGGIGSANYCSYPNTSPTDPPILILANSLARVGVLVDWPRLSLDQRRVYIMHRLVTVYGFSRNAAAGIVGNLEAESGLIPERVEGSSRANPRTTYTGPRTRRVAHRHSAADIQNRRRNAPVRGPRLPGVGLAQWTTSRRRSGLFTHSYNGVTLGRYILFAMDAQIHYLIRELARSYRTLNRRLRARGVSLNDAADDFVYDFERPGKILEPIPGDPRGRKRRRARTDAQVIEVFESRRRRARGALRAYNAAHPVPTETATAITLSAGDMVLRDGQIMGRIAQEGIVATPAGQSAVIDCTTGPRRALLTDKVGHLRPGIEIQPTGASHDAV